MKPFRTLLVLLLAVISLQACTPKMTFLNSTIAPAATGTIRVKKDKNANYVVNVDVANLAPSKNLDPPKTTYLVWMESNDRTVRKLGQLTPSGKALEAKLAATAVANPDVVFISAEDNAEVEYPAGPTVLTTRK
ncbi:hypothetical protein [Spirosoma rhododendri]|uniref:Anti-sigma factor n=1 Tax=Spirosoma rhododendri TaxID=2728024 RepID=A0A7L5DR68_9BACT|nr:hypothetical protein [Spirosoma rhododendri]QJD80916.1 hypothetical protein HH216_22700 [Spirosoma rhododendri]